MSRSGAASGRKRTRDLSALSLVDTADPVDGDSLRLAFAHFTSFKRNEVASRRPQWTAQRVASELARQWEAMDERERRPFVELAEFDHARHLQDQTTLLPTGEARHPTTPLGVPVAKREPLPSKRCKPGNQPRQPDTPYICFWKYERPVVVAEYPNMSAPNVSREVGLRWKALTTKERQEWIDLAARDRERYEDEMAAYRKETSIHEADHSRSSSPTAAAVSAPNPPKSAFQCFLIHNRESLTLLSMTADEFRSEMSDLWKRMGHEEKQMWLDMAAQDQARYEAEMAALKLPVDAHCIKKRLEELKQIAKRMADGPNQPQSAYAFFAASKRHELLLENPLLTTSDVNQEVSRAWKTMNAYERLPFIGDEQRDVERFVRDMETVLALDGGVNDDLLPVTTEYDLTVACETTPSSNHHSPKATTTTTMPRLSRKAKTVVPKRPMTAYNMMYLAKREELMRTYQLSQNECSALCGRMWRQMAESERQQYYRMAALDKERYQREMEHHRRLKGSGVEATGAPTTSRNYRSKSTKDTKWVADMSAQSSQHEDMRRLEQSARVIFGDTLMPPKDEYVDEGANVSPGFRYYVESKRSERERWTKDMWIDDWESLAGPHRQVWEELAMDISSQQPQPSQESVLRYRPDPNHQHQYHRSVVGDLDLLYGLVRGASSPSYGPT